jgi:molybdenum cofactor guanylyltransferase
VPDTPTLSTSDTTIAVLSGGAGSRLDGRDKGLQHLLGRPLVEYVLERMRPQGISVFLCVNRNTEDYAAYGRVCSDHGAPFRGPLAGIAAALEECMTRWLVTVPVDSPLPPADLVPRLFEAATRKRSDCAAAHDGERRQPLFALYSRRMSESAGRALARDLAVWKWQDEIGAVEADFSGARDAFVNLNSAEDFRRWEQLHG